MQQDEERDSKNTQEKISGDHATDTVTVIRSFHFYENKKSKLNTCHLSTFWWLNFNHIIIIQAGKRGTRGR